MKVYSTEHVWHEPWSTVVQAAWRKYPNPISLNVEGLDVAKRTVDENDVLHSHRLMRTRWNLPSYIPIIGGSNFQCHIDEYSTVDRKKKSMKLNSLNLTLANTITVDEKLQYTEHPDNPNWTLQKQEYVINVEGVPMSSYLEEFVKNNCLKNAIKGRESMDWVINSIKDEAQAFSIKAEEQMQTMSKSAVEQLESISKLQAENVQHMGHNYFHQYMNL